MTTLETFAAFSRRIGRDKSYVTRLRQKNRLVVHGEGKAARVNVEASLEAMKQTEGNRQDVAERHAKARNRAQKQKTPDGADATMEEARRTKVLAESRRVAADADRAEIERDKLAGNLIAREDVESVLKFVGAAVRQALEVFPDQIAPLVAPASTLEECHTILTEAAREVLMRLGAAIQQQKEALAKVGG